VRVLLAVSRHPWPPRRGDQVRALQLARALAGLGHEVTLLAPEGPGPAGPRPEGAGAGPGETGAPGDGPPGAERVEVEPGVALATYRVTRGSAVPGVLAAGVRGRPLQSGLFQQRDLARRLRELAPAADLVVLQLVRLAGYLDDVGETPLVVDLIDSLSLNVSRRAAHDRLLAAPLLGWESRRLLAWERRMLERARAGLLVAERDRAWLAERLPSELAEKLAVVPIAIPAPPTGEGRAAPASTPARLVITGNLGYFVNADAVNWWIRDVWPLVRRARPDLELVLAGARPRGRVRRAATAPGVRLLDTPPDLGAVLRSADVALAPTRAGSGVPIKVLEAWSAGVPVVASRWAAAGAAGRPDRDLLVAETPAEWREAILRLLADPPLRDRLVRAARRRVEEEHGEEAVRRAVGEVLRRVED